MYSTFNPELLTCKAFKRFSSDFPTLCAGTEYLWVAGLVVSQMSNLLYLLKFLISFSCRYILPEGDKIRVALTFRVLFRYFVGFPTDNVKTQFYDKHSKVI